jgi:hypothetical protein
MDASTPAAKNAARFFLSAKFDAMDMTPENTQSPGTEFFKAQV